MKEQSLKVVEEEAFESQARAFDHRVIISTCYPASAGPALPGLAGLRELSVSRGGSAGRLCCVWSSSSLGRCLAWAGPPRAVAEVQDSGLSSGIPQAKADHEVQWYPTQGGR